MCLIGMGKCGDLNIERIQQHLAETGDRDICFAQIWWARAETEQASLVRLVTINE